VKSSDHSPAVERAFVESCQKIHHSSLLRHAALDHKFARLRDDRHFVRCQAAIVKFPQRTNQTAFVRH
jgi:hypothetical protein